MKPKLDKKRTDKRKRPKRPVLLRDEERYRLLYGPYEPPLVKRGFLVDAVRGKVPFGTFTNARIPWPKFKKSGKGGSGGIVLCGDLLRALASESAAAISYHWGVCHATVTNWRRALQMKGRTPGAQRLVNLGVELARLPESRKKIAEAARGRVLSREQLSKLLSGIYRGLKERFDARRTAFRETGRFPIATGADPWIPEEEKLLSQLPTSELVRVLGRTAKSIQHHRLLLGIRARPPAERRPRRERDIRALGTAPDRVIAERLRRSAHSVENKRRALGKKPSSIHLWTAQEEAIIGKVSDAEAARRLGRSTKAIQHRRLALGLRFFQVENRREWTAAEDALLGTDTDAAIAKKLGRTRTSVAFRRRQKGIPPQYSKFRPWTAQEIALLGTMSDREAARRLNRSVSSVATKRAASHIPPGINRRWSRSEDKLLGTLRDEDVAKVLGRPVGAVRMRRTKLHIPVFQSQHRLWENWELSLLGTRPDGEVAKRIGRTSSAVQEKRQQFRIPSANVKQLVREEPRRRLSGR
jgi:hypothetical protein